MKHFLKVFSIAAFIFDVIDAIHQSYQVLVAVGVVSVLIVIISSAIPFRHTAGNMHIVEVPIND